MGNLQEGLVSRAEHYKVRFSSFFVCWMGLVEGRDASDAPVRICKGVEARQQGVRRNGAVEKEYFFVSSGKDAKTRRIAQERQRLALCNHLLTFLSPLFPLP